MTFLYGVIAGLVIGIVPAMILLVIILNSDDKEYEEWNKEDTFLKDTLKDNA